MQHVWSVYLDGRQRPNAQRDSGQSDAHSVASNAPSTAPILPPAGGHPLEPPRRPFLDSSPALSRSSSPGAGARGDGSAVSLQINYVPSKFGSVLGAMRRRKGGGYMMPKQGGGVDAFRAGEARMPRGNDQGYDGVDSFRGSGRPRWTRFKWILVFSNSVYTILAIAGLVFSLTTWFDVWEHADIVRVAHRMELIFSTVAASIALFTALVGWAGIVLNNRAFLALYTLFLWFSFALLVTPGYLCYKNYAFNLEGKISKVWSQDLGADGRLRIQNQLHCCGFFSPFVEATVTATCYARSILPGCKGPFLDFDRVVLKRWYLILFALVPVNIGAIVTGLLCSNHVTYRFGKGMMPKAYRLSEKSMAVIMEAYAQQLAEQYGPDAAEEMLSRSRNPSFVSTPTSTTHLSAPSHS